jgi:hypothetical protein
MYVASKQPFQSCMLRVPPTGDTNCRFILTERCHYNSAFEKKQNHLFHLQYDISYATSRYSITNNFYLLFTNGHYS